MIKTSLVTLFFLFNSSSVTNGIQKIDKLYQIDFTPQAKGLVSIDIDEIDYNPERVEEILESKLSDDFNTQLEEAFDLPGEKGRYQQLLQKQGPQFLHQKGQKPDKEEIELDNLMNMGYQGNMYFGEPA